MICDAVIVTYQPNLIALDNLIASVTNQVRFIFIIDNGNEKDQLPNRYPELKIRYASMGFNQGIAAAQNVGIELARENNATHILFLDQDSLAAPDMVSCLFEAIKSLPNAACVGPNYVDIRNNKSSPFIRVQGLKIHRCTCEADTVIPVNFLISSGSLVPIDVLNRVGGFREELFIDYVDIEWAFRAKLKGFQSFGVCNAKMFHSLGEEPIQFMGKKIPIHSPTRQYYQIRNAIWLYKQKYIPFNWKYADGWRCMIKFIFYSIFASPRLVRTRLMILGIYHGIRGRMGPI